MGKITIYTNESDNATIAEGLRRRGLEAYSARDTGNLGLTDEGQLIPLPCPVQARNGENGLGILDQVRFKSVVNLPGLFSPRGASHTAARVWLECACTICFSLLLIMF
jgi:hypothetical protein